MDADARLLGRLRAAPIHGEPHRSAPIVAHLRALLTTRPGSSLLDPDYGLPDLTEVAHAVTPEGTEVAQLIAACVRRHEPRLRDVSVHAAPRSTAAPTALAFTLSATLDDGASLRLTGSLGPGGQLTLLSCAR